MFQDFRNPGIVKALELLVEYCSNSTSTTAAFNTKGRGVTRLLEFLTGAFNEHVHPEDLKELYKVYICKEEKGEGGKGFLKNKSENTLLHLWCFSPGFSMQRLARLGARSIILTSGTLSPLQATAEEIGLDFPVRLENQHIVTSSQVWCGVLGSGPDGTILNSSYNTRNDPKYLAALGQIVIMILKIVPKGVLIFFPSYGLLNSTREFWQANGIWTRIDNVKKIVVEPQKKEVLSLTMNEYYDEIRTGRGACFMAVCRGKVAEGLDFADNNGRAVLVTGLPYPPFKDARVELKRQFLDDQLKMKKGNMTGQKWYQLEAFRATNQAVGRVIRHSRDYGAVIFLDNRFGDQVARNCLSKWLQPHFTKYPSLGPAIKNLASFFKKDSSIGHLRQQAVQKQTDFINKSKGIKRPLKTSDSDDGDKPDNTESLRDIYGGASDGAAGGKKEEVASSIFAQSSEAISFASQAPRERSELPSRPSVSASLAPKKKKIKISSSRSLAFNEDVSDGPSSSSLKNSEQENVSNNGQQSRPEITNLSVNYLKRIKQALSISEMAQFKSSLKEYKAEEKFEALVPVLCVIAKTKTEGLLEDFRVFVKAKHLSDFELFCNVTSKGL